MDIATRSQAEEIFGRATMRRLRGGTLILDMTDLDFMDGKGVHLLVRAAAEARDRGAGMRIRVKRTGPVRRVVDILGPGTGLDLMLEPGMSPAVTTPSRMWSSVSLFSDSTDLSDTVEDEE